MKTLEIAEKEFIELERNVIDLQVQLRDMEDLELHRDELFQKLQYVKKQRDEFLEKGRIVEEERNEFVRSNKSLEQYIIDWKRKTTEFKKTNQALKDRVSDFYFLFYSVFVFLVSCGLTAKYLIPVLKVSNLTKSQFWHLTITYSQLLVTSC